MSNKEMQTEVNLGLATGGCFAQIQAKYHNCYTAFFRDEIMQGLDAPESLPAGSSFWGVYTGCAISTSIPRQ
jgi:hypothetical protein